jgi:O-antigen/teichoic acid export membrane protein
MFVMANGEEDRRSLGMFGRLGEGSGAPGEKDGRFGATEGSPDGRFDTLRDETEDPHGPDEGASGGRLGLVGNGMDARLALMGTNADGSAARTVTPEGAAEVVSLSRVERYGRRGRRRIGRIAALLSASGLLGNTVKTMFISVLILLLNMATGVLTARWLGPEGRGVQTALVLWPQFFAFTTTLGIHSALTFYMKKEPEQENALYASGMLMALVTGGGAIAVGTLVIPFRLADYPAWVTAAGLWLMAVVPFVHIHFLNTAYLRAREQFKLFNRTRWLIPMMTLVMLAALAAAGRLTPLTAAVAYQLAYVPIAVWAVARDIRVFRAGWKAMREAAGKLSRYGLRSYGVDLLGNLIVYIDQILLIGLLAPEALGLYVVAVSLSRMLNVFSMSIVAVLFPEASGLPEAEAAKLSLRVFKISMLCGLAAALAMSALAPFLLRILYGSAFAAAIPVFRLLVLAVVIGGAAMVLAQAFMAVGKPGVASMALGLELVVLVPLLLTLVPVYGLIGAGWSLLIAAAVRLLFVTVRFRARFRCGFRALWPDKADFAWVTGALKQRRAAKAGG